MRQIDPTETQNDRGSHGFCSIGNGLKGFEVPALKITHRIAALFRATHQIIERHQSHLLSSDRSIDQETGEVLGLPQSAESLIENLGVWFLLQVCCLESSRPILEWFFDGHSFNA